MIGRNREIRELNRAFESAESEFVAVYGRRRIGKTYLITEVLRGVMTFHAAGIEGEKKHVQLEAFRAELRRQGHGRCPKLRSWIEAFGELECFLEGRSDPKKVVFLDELPWFDSPCSGFLKAFEWFWNSWACARKDILLVVCGSATTWIMDKVINSRGGLHGRVTVEIPLVPFTLNECEQFVAYRRLGFDRRQILEAYMAFGGVAYYWCLLREGESMAQNFDRLFFGVSNELRVEFDRVFKSLYRTSTLHVEIVKLLGRVKRGMTRDDVVKGLGVASGGDTSRELKELEQCGFVRHYNVIDKCRYGGLYQLVDPYCIFYFDFLEGRRGNDLRHWTRNYNAPSVNAWRGLAFERVCLWHVDAIKRALGISGIEADVYSWRWVSPDASEPGVQIDMLIDRADGMVNVCEMKYSDEEYLFDKVESDKLRHRVEVFRRESGVRKSVQPVLICAHGIKDGKYTGDILHHLSADDLFKESV